MLTYRDEKWAYNVLKEFLEPGEALVSVGKAMGKGYSYYTGLTDGRAIFKLLGSASKHPRSVPLEKLEPFLKRKRIELLPFLSPFLSGEKANRTFGRLRQIAELHNDEGGCLRTIARAEYRSTHYCLAFYEDKIIAAEITRRSTEVTGNQNYEVIPFPSIFDSFSFSKNREVSLDVPFHSGPAYMTIMLENGDIRLYGITNISGLVGPSPGIA